MDITNIFCQSLGVTSHAKTFLTVCRFRTDLVSCLNGSGYPFKKKFVRTTWAIRLKNFVIRSNDLDYPFQKSCHPFERLGISGVAKTRVGVNPRGEGEFKGRVKAYGNITVPMIMQLSFIRYSHWFC